MFESEDCYRELDLINDPLVAVGLEVNVLLRELVDSDHPFDDPLPGGLLENFDPSIRKQFAAIVTGIQAVKKRGVPLDLSQVLAPVKARKSAVAVEYVGDKGKFLDSLVADPLSVSVPLRDKAILLRGVDWTPPEGMPAERNESVDRDGLLPLHTDGPALPGTSLLALHCTSDLDPGSWLTGLAPFEPSLTASHAAFRPTLGDHIEMKAPSIYSSMFSAYASFNAILNAALAVEDDETKLLRVLGASDAFTDLILKDSQGLKDFQDLSLMMLNFYHGENRPPVYLHAWSPGDLLLVSHRFFHGRFASGQGPDRNGQLMRYIF